MTRRSQRNPGPAVVLLSGGMDSATVLALASRRGHAPIYALIVRYGQRHAREVRAARAVARHFGATPIEIAIPLFRIASSALTRKDIPLPRDRRRGDIGRGIPATYVPARNTVFLSLALALAETTRSSTIYLGINAVDYSGYPDCRPAYLRAFRRLARLATRAGVTGEGIPRIEAPLLALGKAEIVLLGDRLGVPWEKTWSCYAGGHEPCHRCDACRLREEGFRRAAEIRNGPAPPRKRRGKYAPSLPLGEG